MLQQTGSQIVAPFFPVSLAEDVAETSSAKWYALNIRRRMEPVTASYLGQKGYEYLLPMQNVKTECADRVKETKRALFPGYMFCKFDSETRIRLLQTPGVLSIVGFGRELTPVSETEIEALSRIVNSQEEAESCEFIRKGQRVEIMRGALKGLQGFITAAGSGLRLVVSVEILQRSVSVHVERGDVRPC